MYALNTSESNAYFGAEVDWSEKSTFVARNVGIPNDMMLAYFFLSKHQEHIQIIIRYQIETEILNIVPELLLKNYKRIGQYSLKMVWITHLRKRKKWLEATKIIVA